jgi:hypothetical protein
LNLPEVIHDPSAAPLALSAIEEVTSFLTGYLSAKMDRGELCKADAGLAAHLLLGGIMDIVLRRGIIRDPTVLGYSHEQIAQSVITTTLPGLIPR